MALITCPECGKQISDAAKACPGCGYPINKSSSQKSIQSNDQNKTKIIIGVVVAVTVAIVIIILNSNSKHNEPYRNDSYYSYSGENDYSYGGTNSSSGKDSSSIFKNLDIDDFSYSIGKYSGTMQCKVTNNNGFTVHGYFRVNFYDSSGSLIYNQLMSLPDVGAGESIVCSTSIPKDDYPTDYQTVDFSQASLTDSN